MVTHAYHYAVLLTQCTHFYRLPDRIEAQGVAQQVVHGPLDQRRPTLQGQPRLRFKAHILVGRAEQGILAHAAQQGVEVDRFGMSLLGIHPGQGQNFADQVFQAVALAGQAWPQGFPLLGLGALGQRQGNSQPGQWGAQLVGHIAQQLALAADGALQARAHLVEVLGQHTELVAPRCQPRQAVLLVGGLPQVMHRAAQAAERAGNGQGHQQAEQRQHNQGDAQCTERPHQAFAVPGIQCRVGNAVDQQVGFAGVGAGVFLGQPAPRQAPLVIVLARFEGRSTAREGAGHHGFATVVEHLHVDLVAVFAPFQEVLCRIQAFLLVMPGPLAGQGIQARVTAEDPGVLVEHVAQQDRQACDQGNGQPETGQDAPEQ